MSAFKPTRLYIKQHTKTGLKYFGKSIKQDIEKYLGSGSYWLNHIRKHGIEFVETLWVSEWFYTKEEIALVAKQLSVEYDIVNSNEWANLKEETGSDGGLLPDYAINSVRHKLTGRTKETHEYIRRASEKKSQYSLDNSEWIRESRKKFRETVSQMSEEERKSKFGHSFSDEVKQKFREERIGKTKDTCERVKKMSETIKNNISHMSEEERKQRFTTTAGRKWFHSDSLMKSILVDPNEVPDGFVPGRKYYEN